MLTTVSIAEETTHYLEQPTTISLSQGLAAASRSMAEILSGEWQHHKDDH